MLIIHLFHVTLLRYLLVRKQIIDKWLVDGTRIATRVGNTCDTC